MEKKISFLLLALFVASNSLAATNFMQKRFNTVTSHDDVYPYRLNNAKPSDGQKATSTNTINSNSVKPIGKRSVIKRKTNARAATTSNANYYNSGNDNSARRVVQRNNTVSVRSANTKITPRASNGRENQNVVARSAQTRTTNTSRTTVNYSGDKSVSSQRCFADYKECMEMYCLREDTAYNRCYCSAKLAQIDAKYQNKIDELIQKIIRLQHKSSVTSEEIKEYWDQTVGVYTKDNPWVNIDNALNIEWPDNQSRINGQNAFNTGHQYCSQHLRACYYMASNLRDAYKSEIARDCETYEKSLQKIQDAAESVIESYND